MKHYKTFQAFYPFYLSEHANPINRLLHFVGTTLVLLGLVTFIALKLYWYIFLLPIIGYGFAWIGHFIFEKNRPATFTYPFYSFIADFRMWWDIIRGKAKLLK